MRSASVRRLRARLLLATFVLTLGLTGLSKDHLGIIDIACGAASLSIGDRVATVGDASDGDAQHCPVCHFLQAVRGASATSEARLATPGGLAAPVLTAIAAPAAIDLLTRPSRGPPPSVQSAL